MASLLVRLVKQRHMGTRWKHDAQTVKTYTAILSKPPNRRTLKDLEQIFGWFSTTQSQFYKSLAKDTTTRNAVLFELCRHVKLVAYEPETLLMRQGDTGDAFYIMFTGTADIYYKSDTSAVANLASNLPTAGGTAYAKQSAMKRREALGRVVKTVHPGESFGELALRQKGARRTASVVINGLEVPDEGGGPTQVQSAELLVLTREVYERCVRANHESGNVLERKIRHLEAMHLFRDWSTSDVTFLAYSLRQRRLKDSEVLFQAGDPTTHVYMVHTGKILLLEPAEVRYDVKHGVQVHHKVPQVELEIVPMLGIVGELSMLHRKSTYLHTAVAIGPTHLWVCTNHVFQRLFGRWSKRPMETGQRETTFKRLTDMATKRQDWHRERLAVARAEGVLGFTPPLTISMQAGMVPCGRCGDCDHPSTSKYCPRLEQPEEAPDSPKRTPRSPKRRHGTPRKSLRSPIMPRPSTARSVKSRGSHNRVTSTMSKLTMQSSRQTPTLSRRNGSGTFLTQPPASPTFRLSTPRHARSKNGSMHNIRIPHPAKPSAKKPAHPPKAPPGMVRVRRRGTARSARGIMASTVVAVTPSISGIVCRQKRRSTNPGEDKPIKAGTAKKVPIYRAAVGGLACIKDVWRDMNTPRLPHAPPYVSVQPETDTNGKGGATEPRAATPVGNGSPLAEPTRSRSPATQRSVSKPSLASVGRVGSRKPTQPRQAFAAPEPPPTRAQVQAAKIAAKQKRLFQLTGGSDDDIWQPTARSQSAASFERPGRRLRVPGSTPAPNTVRRLQLANRMLRNTAAKQQVASARQFLTTFLNQVDDAVRNGGFSDDDEFESVSSYSSRSPSGGD